MSKPSRLTAVQLAILAAGVDALVGCSPSVPSGPPPIPRPAADPNRVALEVVDRAGYDAIIAKQRGQVVLVDHWATWCLPCVEHFGHFVELAARHGERGLVVISLSFDLPSDAEATLKFLKSHRAGALVNLTSQNGGSTQSMGEFNVPNGSLPCYKLYDRDGKLRQTFTVNYAAKRQFTLQDVDAAVEQLLAE